MKTGYEELTPVQMVEHAILCVARQQPIPAAIRDNLDEGTIKALELPGEQFYGTAISPSGSDPS